jgi:predicted nucleic acid-binding protein
MPKRYFFDTSALIKLYHREAGTAVLDKLIKAATPQIVISDLCLIEMTSALAKQLRTRAIRRKTFTAALTAFESDVSKFEVVEIDKRIKTSASALIKQLGTTEGLRTLDALQLAAALNAARVAPLDLFIVADKALAAIATKQGLKVLLV